MTVDHASRYVRERIQGYPLARPPRLSLESLADITGLHPQLLRQFVALSLIDASRDASGQLWFTANAPLTIARIQRLHAWLSLNYAAVGVVMDLLDRIDELESELARHEAAGRASTGSEQRWI